VSFASGWQPNDFLLKPENFARAKEVMSEQIDVVRQLWRGETVTFEGPKGPVDVQTHPRPVQSELPVWITTAGNPATFELAGHKGAFILTHLLGQNIEELGEKLAAYRRAWREAGHEGDGHVTLMLHTFVDDDAERVRKVVHEPLKRYLSTSANLIKQFASTFPAFKHVDGVSGSIDRAFEALSEEDMDALLDHAVLRYEETSGLFGTPAACIAMVDRLKSIEVDEIACLIDFGIATDDVLGSLPALERLKTMSNVRPAVSIPEEIRRHGVTHFQCTPSQAGMLLADPEAVDALGSLRQMLAGGERLPPGTADKLWKATEGRLLNVYGPTETTIWSTTHTVQKGEDPVSIGRPIANTRLYVLSATRDAVPPGMVGELYIGGEGVTRGYLNRPELTAERFVADPFANGSGGRLYRTGDVVRYRSDGDLEFVGRLDDQVKLGGHRIELGEIASALQEHESVREAVAVVRHDGPTGADLVAYIVPRTGNGTDAPALTAFLRDRLPESMVPSTIHKLAALPLTPNNKIDRKALPSPWTARPREVADVVPALRNGVQATIAQIWEAVLNRQGIDHDASFFDLGGRSLLALEVQRRLEKHFARRVPLTILFRHPTISSLATHFASEPASAESVGTQRAAQRKAARRRARGE
jgi:natural product biosynthesis luciferase-like monooxygenase protein